MLFRSEWDEVQPPPPTTAGAGLLSVPMPMPMLPPSRSIHMVEIDPAPTTRPSRPTLDEPEDNEPEDEDAWGDFEAEMERVCSADPEQDQDHDMFADGAGGEEEEDFLSAAIQENPQYDAGDSDDDDSSTDDSDDD